MAFYLLSCRGSGDFAGEEESFYDDEALRFSEFFTKLLLFLKYAKANGRDDFTELNCILYFDAPATRNFQSNFHVL